MDEPTQEDLFLDAVDAMVLNALARIGDDPRVRFAFFRRLLAVAPGMVGALGLQVRWFSFPGG